MLIYTVHSQDLIAKKCHLVIVVTPFNMILIRLNIIVSLNWHVPSLLHLLTFPEVSLAVEDAVYIGTILDTNYKDRIRKNERDTAAREMHS